MSAFKFACPVCGQHITADAAASGTQIECPTCFQKIVVPQAPVSDSKYILSASKAGTPRTSMDEAVANAEGRRQRGPSAGWIGGLLFLTLAAAGAVYGYKWYRQHAAQQEEQPATVAATNQPTSPFPAPTNFGWNLSITNAPRSPSPAAGRLHGLGFQLERSTFQGGTLALRQGKTWPPDLGVTILFPAKLVEEFSGKTVEVWPERPPPIPRVILRWKDENQQPRTREFRQGYALKAVFGSPSDGRLPGQIYLALPDDDQSFLSGTFSAEIRPNAPARKTSKKTAPGAPPPPATNTPAPNNAQ